MQEVVYSKHRYDIDLLLVIPKIKSSVDQKNLATHITSSKTEYLKNLDIAAEETKKTLTDEYNNLYYCIVPPTHPSYDFWMALNLSTLEKHLIPLILNYHLNSIDEARDSRLKFLNTIENMVLPLFKTIVPVKCTKCEKAISKWIQKKREYDPFATNRPPKQSKLSSNFIKYPYNELLLEDLSPFVESESKENLFQLINGTPIKKPIVLKPGFKKISLIRAIRHLISKEHLLFNKKEAADWIVNNFAIRKIENGEKELDSFSLSSTIKQMSKPLNEPKNAQIRFYEWKTQAASFNKDSK